MASTRSTSVPVGRFATSVLSAVLALLAASPAPCAAADGPTSSLKQWKYKGSRLEVGSLYRYERSSLDGAKEGFLLVFVRERNRISALRGEKGGATADEFAVEIDWDKGGSASRFEWFTVGKDGAKRRAVLGETFQEGGVLQLTPGDLAGSRLAPFDRGNIAVEHLPVHIVPLDLVTLDLAIRFMADPRKDAQVGIIGDGSGAPGSLPFAWKGKATIRFAEIVNRDGADARKYTVTGDFLGGAEAAIWVDDAKGHILDAEIPLSAGGWKDVKFYLGAATKTDEAGWDRARADALATLK